MFVISTILITTGTGENAPECLSLVHYTEFMESKGIVLMGGEYDKNTLVSTFDKCRYLDKYWGEGFRMPEPSSLPVHRTLGLQGHCPHGWVVPYNTNTLVSICDN
jgi:hypothetical protein